MIKTMPKASGERVRLGQRLPLSQSPLDLSPNVVTDTFAWLGIRGSGKSTGAKHMAEEFCRLQLPWIALDPASVWWGLRSMEDGSPSTFPVVVFGGPHSDLPLRRDKGAQIARAIVRESVCAVIDLKREPKAFWRTFLVDFCLELMETEPAQPYHVFIEEAKNFVPQKGRTDLTARTKEAVERLVAEGRNCGYGCSLISQRAATVDKDVLSQCENLVVLRTVGKHDRKALQDYLEEHEGGVPNMPAISGMAAGEAYYWCPRDHVYAHVQLYKSVTFHPGRTRQAWEKAGGTGAVQLGDVNAFVKTLQTQLAEDAAPATSGSAVRRGKKLPLAEVRELNDQAKKIVDDHFKREADQDFGDFDREYEPGRGYREAKARIAELEQQLTAERDRVRSLKDDVKLRDGALAQIRSRLERIVGTLQPFAEAYAILTSPTVLELVQAVTAQAVVEVGAVWAPWLEKAGGPGSMRRRMLEVMIERRQVTRTQLCTLAGASPRGGSTRNAISWLSVNKLIVRDGEQITLAEVG